MYIYTFWKYNKFIQLINCQYKVLKYNLFNNKIFSILDKIILVSDKMHKL